MSEETRAGGRGKGWRGGNDERKGIGVKWNGDTRWGRGFHHKRRWREEKGTPIAEIHSELCSPIKSNFWNRRPPNGQTNGETGHILIQLKLVVNPSLWSFHHPPRPLPNHHRYHPTPTLPSYTPPLCSIPTLPTLTPLPTIPPDEATEQLHLHYGNHNSPPPHTNYCFLFWLHSLVIILMIIKV